MDTQATPSINRTLFLRRYSELFACAAVNGVINSFTANRMTLSLVRVAGVLYHRPQKHGVQEVNSDPRFPMRSRKLIHPPPTFSTHKLYFTVVSFNEEQQIEA